MTRTRTRTRTLLAATLAALLVVAFAAPASAGPGSSVTISASCDTATGEYDLTFDLHNSGGAEGGVVVQDYQVDGVPTAPQPVFSPDPIPAAGDATAQSTVPGDTGTVFIEVEINFGTLGVIVNDAIDLGGDCETIATTTVTEVELETTTTQAVAAQAVARQPAFTG